MTHIKVEARQELSIPDLLIVVIEELISLNNYLYWENEANTFANLKIVLSNMIAI